MAKQTHVTGKENIFSDSAILLSTTDLKGRVTYANQDFCDIAGYTNEELVGHGHNIVRHPDMPKAAFENLWQTIQGGQSWMGPVKNRCKNGDHYWVNGYVTPIKDSEGKITEYQSVRSTLDRDVVDRAEAVYKKINSATKPISLKKYDTTQYLIWLLSFIATFLLSAPFYTETPMFVGVSAGILMLAVIAVFAGWRVRYKKLIARAKHVFDNPLMSYLYSGSHDEMGYINLALKMSTSEVTAVVGRVQDVSLHVGSIAAETAANGSDVSQMLVEQNGEIEQVATAMGQMSSTIQELSSSVTDASDASGQSQEITSQGLSAMEQTTSAIENLSQQLNNIRTVVETLAEGRNSIASMSDEISAIADQTNLLALNAAIEAARAGEQGRGFAVVAEEVRALASRTQQSTDEIRNMLESLNSESEHATQAIETGVLQVNRCLDSAHNSGQTFKDIHDEVDKVSSLNLHIATAVEEQSVVSEQINQNTLAIRDIASQGVEHGHQSEQLGQKLINELNTMQNLINQFFTPQAQK